MSKAEEDAFIVKAAKWGAAFAEEVARVGGSPVSVLREFSDESIQIMVRNGLAVKGAK